jgi:hypothetical protein
MRSKKVACRICPIHFEAQLAGLVASSDADIVEHGRCIEEFGVKLQVHAAARQPAPAIYAQRVVIVQVVLRVTNELGQLACELAVWNANPRHFLGHHGYDLFQLSYRKAVCKRDVVVESAQDAKPSSRADSRVRSRGILVRFTGDARSPYPIDIPNAVISSGGICRWEAIVS